jgi:hypothetical protein
MNRFLLALGVCLLAVVSTAEAQIILDQDGHYRPTIRAKSVQHAARAHYKGRQRVVRRAYVRHVRTVKHESSHGCGALAAVHAGRAVACVARSAVGAFQAFVSALESTGYRIDFMGGWWAHGSCRGCNMHPRGLAIDINQTARNRVTRRFPSGVTELAARYGILHGAVWHNADTGHFEVAQPGRYARRYAMGGRS